MKAGAEKKEMGVGGGGRGGQTNIQVDFLTAS